MGGGADDVRHGRRVRRRSQRVVHRRLAAHQGARGARAHRPLDQDLQPDGRGRGPRPGAGADQAAAREQPRAASASSGSTCTWRTTGIRTCRSAETLGALRRARPRRARSGAVGASNVDGAQLREALEASERDGTVRFEWVQNSYSLLDREAEREVLPLCAEHGLGFTPFSPLAGGWLTGQVPPRRAGARRLADDDAARALPAPGRRRRGLERPRGPRSGWPRRAGRRARRSRWPGCSPSRA